VVSHSCIKRVLRINNYKKRQPAKSIAVGKSPHRAQQFEIVFFLIALFMTMDNNPIISIDTKKKEILGQLTRNKAVLSKEGQAVPVYDHDFLNLATGKAIPHGIFDTKLNKGYISIGSSHETALFIKDNLDWWWQEFGQYAYPHSTTILILCDSGGANGHRHHLFKKCLQEWAKKIGKRLVVAHYPPYCSKFNPIERKLFAHVQRTIDNVILTDLQQVKELMMKTSTTKGLSVEVRINDKFYPTKQLSRQEDIKKNKILKHPDLPNLSYTILP
jgi:Rhodopirellula transposase DDE domain